MQAARHYERDNPKSHGVQQSQCLSHLWHVRILCSKDNQLYHV